MATAAAVTCLAWLGLVHIVLVACQGQVLPGMPVLQRPAAFVISPDSPVREVFCRNSGPNDFVFSDPLGSGELKVRVPCPRRGFISIRLPAPPNYRAELTQGGPKLPTFGFMEPFPVMPDPQQYRMVALHNHQRSMVFPTAQRMYQLNYEMEFAQRADAWVARCSVGLEGSGLGENVAKLRGRWSVEDAVGMAFKTWMENRNTQRQVLVDDAKAMGCAFNPYCHDFTGDFTLVACYYEKPDQRPNEPYPYVEGTSCSQCSRCVNRLCQS